MHPAPSIIVFTTLSGLGYGLAAVLGLGLLDPAALATKIAHVLALALIAGGLLSSTLHLGNPQRAWRALSQWRSSWLSREGVMAIADLRAACCASAWRVVVDGRYIALPGLLGAVLAGGHGLLHGDDLRLAEIGRGLAHAADAALLPAVCRCGRLRCWRASLPRPAARAAADPARCWRCSSWSRPGSPRSPGGGGCDELTPLSTPESATGLGFIGTRAAVRAAAYERELPDQRDGLSGRAQACARSCARIALAARRRAARRCWLSCCWSLRRQAGRPAAVLLSLAVASPSVPACWSNAGCSSPKRGTP